MPDFTVDIDFNLTVSMTVTVHADTEDDAWEYVTEDSGLPGMLLNVPEGTEVEMDVQGIQMVEGTERRPYADPPVLIPAILPTEMARHPINRPVDWPA